MPEAAPRKSKPMLIPRRLVLIDMARMAQPQVMAETTMVFRCVNLEEINPAPVRAMKYPTEMRKKKDPAPPWLRPRSFSMEGMRGAMMTRARKFKKKMDVRKRIGPTWDRSDGGSPP